MKTIEPVSVWVNGEVKIATILNVVSSYDDLSTFATFKYFLQQEQLVVNTPPSTISNVVATGEVLINGQDYIDWNDSNDAAYAYVAEKLNLTIVVPE
jgi:hypothetical protein